MNKLPMVALAAGLLGFTPQPGKAQEVKDLTNHTQNSVSQVITSPTPEKVLEISSPEKLREVGYLLLKIKAALLKVTDPSSEENKARYEAADNDIMYIQTRIVESCTPDYGEIQEELFIGGLNMLLDSVTKGDIFNRSIFEHELQVAIDEYAEEKADEQTPKVDAKEKVAPPVQAPEPKKPVIKTTGEIRFSQAGQ